MQLQANERSRALLCTYACLEQVNTGNRLCSQISRSLITSLVSFRFAIFKSLDLYQPISSVFQSAASRWDEFIPLVTPEQLSVQTSSSVQARFPMSFMVIGDYGLAINFLHCLPLSTVVCYKLNLFQALKWATLWFSSPQCLQMLRRGLSRAFHMIPTDVEGVSIASKTSHFPANGLMFVRTISSLLIMNCVTVAWSC